MPILETIETEGRTVLNAVERAAAWLVGRVATSEQSLHTLEAASPLVSQAFEVGAKAAAEHGVPVAIVGDVGEAVLMAARSLAAGLAAPAEVRLAPAPIAPAESAPPVLPAGSDLPTAPAAVSPPVSSDHTPQPGTPGTQP